MTLEPTRLFLVRHGQTDLNRDRRFRGMSDAPLNEAGIDEARGAAGLLAAAPLAAIHTSPIPRAAETARIIAEVTGAGVVEDDGFTDIDYGEWQGLTVEEVTERFGADEIGRWRSDPGGFTFPGGDSMESVRERIRPALERVAGGHPGANACVVSHLAVLKVCYVAALDLPWDYFWRVVLDNGSVGSLLFEAGTSFTLESWNRLPPGSLGGVTRG